ncbi:MAG: hypothetical protein ACO1TE_17425 [Prosthecobacter sp.]
MRITEASTQTRLSVWTPGRDMTGTYPVEWRPLFASLAFFLTVMFVLAVVTGLVAQFVKAGFDASRIFEHVSPWSALLLLLGAPVLAVVVAFVVAMMMRVATITLTDKTIEGVNYGCFKKRIPLEDITKLFSFSQNGIRATVVHSPRHGNIYISENTHRLTELLQFLNATIAENEERRGQERGL